MYTNTVVGSYNAIANSEHHAMIMKPPIKKQPRKSNSKEIHSPPSQASRGNSEDGGGPVANPMPLQPHPLVVSKHHSHPERALPDEGITILPGLEILTSIESVEVCPDRTHSPEVAKIGFIINDGGEGATPLLKCLPSEESSPSRSLLFQTLEGVKILEINTATPYCCSWYKNLEAKIGLPGGPPFGTIMKTAFGPFKCHRKFMMTCQKNETEKIQFEVEVLVTPSEFLIKRGDEVVATVTSKRGMDCKSLYKLSFAKPTELNPNLKAMFIIFAMILHIAFAEKLNTCLGMGLCCIACSSCATWVLCIF